MTSSDATTRPLSHGELIDYFGRELAEIVTAQTLILEEHIWPAFNTQLPKRVKELLAEGKCAVGPQQSFAITVHLPQGVSLVSHGERLLKEGIEAAGWYLSGAINRKAGDNTLSFVVAPQPAVQSRDAAAGS
jgi:hypothetical protein